MGEDLQCTVCCVCHSVYGNKTDHLSILVSQHIACVRMCACVCACVCVCVCVCVCLCVLCMIDTLLFYSLSVSFLLSLYRPRFPDDSLRCTFPFSSLSNLFSWLGRRHAYAEANVSVSRKINSQINYFFVCLIAYSAFEIGKHTMGHWRLQQITDKFTS